MINLDKIRNMKSFVVLPVVAWILLSSSGSCSQSTELIVMRSTSSNFSSISYDDVFDLCSSKDLKMCLNLVRNSTLEITVKSKISYSICSRLENGVSCLHSYLEACDVENKIDFTTMIVVLEHSMPARIACGNINEKTSVTLKEKEAEDKNPEQQPSTHKKTKKHRNKHKKTDPNTSMEVHEKSNRTAVWAERSSLIKETGLLYTSMYTPCYNKPEVMKCNQRFKKYVKMDENTRPDDETCRHFRIYHNCVESVIIMKCDLQEHEYIENYLMEHAKFLVWKCPEHNVIAVIRAHFDVGSFLAPLLKLKTCVPKMKQMFTNCQRILNSNLHVAARTTNDTSVYKTMKCCAIAEFFQCTKFVTLMKCGLKGGKVVVEAIRSYHEHEYAQCRGYEYRFLTRCAACPLAKGTFSLILISYVLNIYLKFVLG